MVPFPSFHSKCNISVENVCLCVSVCVCSAVYMRLSFLCLENKIIVKVIRERRHWVPYFVSCFQLLNSRVTRVVLQRLNNLYAVL